MSTLECPDYSSTRMNDVPADLYLSYVTKSDDNLYSATICDLVDRRSKIEDPDPIAFFRNITGQSITIAPDPYSDQVKCTLNLTNLTTGNCAPINFTCSGNLMHKLNYHIRIRNNFNSVLEESVQLSGIPPSDTSPFEPWLNRMRTDSESGRADVMIKYIPNPYHQTFGRTVSCEDVLSDEHCDDTNNWASSEILNEVGYHGISGQTLRFIKDPQTPNKYLVVTVPNEYPDHPSEPERYFSMDRRMAEQIEVVDDDAEGWTRGTIGLLGDFKSAIT